MAEKTKLKGLSRELIALRVASELEDGTYVNLGIGIPTLISDWIEGRDITLQSEIGMLKTGPLATGDDVNQDLINASCQAVTELPGSSYFDIAESFGMIRGGHIDVAVMGALQINDRGDYAGWSNPARGLFVGNVGGSMDLCAGAKKLFIAMEHQGRTVQGRERAVVSGHGNGQSEYVIHRPGGNRDYARRHGTARGGSGNNGRGHTIRNRAEANRQP
jgi:3-oxoacid CoA-transferase subunit B